MVARTSKALAAWTELNDRQQGTLATIYALDQAAETGRRRDAARGVYDNRPADAWRSIDFAHEPSLRAVFGWTLLQERLMGCGWDNQGNGSTMAALTRRGLIDRDSRPTRYGFMHTVRLTREGRAAARAGSSLTPGGPRKAALGQRSWEVLALLWAAGLRGEPLKWGHSTTIERALVDKHVPPLARSVPGGYEITDRGCDFYREHYAAHTAAHPEIRAPHPNGADAEPWPAAADETLAQHWRLYRSLLTAWKDASAAQQAAEQEASAPLPKVPAVLPDSATALIETRHKVWRETAEQRATLASAHGEDLRARAEHAARSYAAAALAAHRAAVTGANPVDALVPPALEPDTWDEAPLLAPAETGIHAIDTEAQKLHAVVVGRPKKRRGPAPTRRTRRGYVRVTQTASAEPGAALFALAHYLHGQVQGGELLRRLIANR